MKCVQIINDGFTDILSFHDIPMPIIAGKDLLVKVHAVGINPIDLKFIKDRETNHADCQIPLVVGGDFSGEIVATGERVSLFKKGMQVYGNGFVFAGGSGALAQYLQVDETLVALKPDSLSHASAAAAVTPGCTAHWAINKLLRVKPNDKILISGAGGAIGWHAIQLCTNIGAEVAVTVKQQDIPIMKELGVDLIIDAQKQAFDKLVRNYDAVFDIKSNYTKEHYYQVLKPTGKVVSLSDQQFAPEVNTRTLNTLRFLFDEQILTPCTPQIFPFSQSIKAIEEKIEKNNKHKIVIQITE